MYNHGMRRFLLALVLSAAPGGVSAQTEAPAAPSPAPLWLGSPGTDVAQARARVKERQAARLRWEQAASIGDYERAGEKNPAWDADVRKALEQYARVLAQEKGFRTVGAKPAIAHAQAAGCKDPLMAFAYLDLRFYPPNTDPAALACLYAGAEQEMERSGYSPLRKLWASFRAAEQALKVNEAPPDGTDPAGTLVRARTHLVELLRDPAVPPDSVFAAALAFLGFAQDHPATAAPVMEPLAALFESTGADALKPTATTRLVEGLFWVDYAWQARTRRWADNVTADGWRLFGARLPRAAAALEAAYALDPGDTHVAQTMLTVELGQGQGRERMETWFRRALDADPDSYAACSAKAEYLKPKWYGSEEELLEFAHQCVATENWPASQPFILPEAHRSLADRFDPPADYWKRPEVWADLRAFYEAALKVNPKNNYLRTSYALCACRAEDWQRADELFNQIGDKPGLESWEGTRARYDELRRVAASKRNPPTP